MQSRAQRTLTSPNTLFSVKKMTIKIEKLCLSRMSLSVISTTEEAAKILTAPTLTSLTWRVDVVLSSSSVTRVMQPFVIMRVGLSDGTFRTIEMSVKAFHDLRFRVAEALHSLHKLESNYLFSLRV